MAPVNLDYQVPWMPQFALSGRNRAARRRRSGSERPTCLPGTRAADDEASAVQISSPAVYGQSINMPPRISPSRDSSLCVTGGQDGSPSIDPDVPQSDNTLPPLEKLVETRKKERPKDKSSGGATEVLPGGNCACEDEGFRLLASSKEQTPDGAALDNATRATSYTNGLYHVSQAASPTTAPISHIFHESYLSHDFERTSYPIDPALTTYHQGETGTLSEVPGACGPNQSACSLEAFRGASYGRELDGAISVSSLATAGGDERCQVGIETGEQLSPGDDWSGNGLPYFRTSDRRHGHTIRSDDATSSILVGQTPHLDHHRAEEHADTVQPPRKRHRAGSPFRTLPSPPASTSTDIDADDVSKVAEFEEWALENVVLKRIMVDGVATFQLQFDWNLCIKHCGSKPKPPKRVQRGANRSAPQRRNSARQSKFTADEDDLILRLKDELQLPWTEIHRRHIEQYPGRSKGSLQVRYCTKLKCREGR